jgi:hypothetical protein
VFYYVLVGFFFIMADKSATKARDATGPEALQRYQNMLCAGKQAGVLLVPAVVERRYDLTGLADVQLQHTRTRQWLTIEWVASANQSTRWSRFTLKPILIL